MKEVMVEGRECGGKERKIGVRARKSTGPLKIIASVEWKTLGVFQLLPPG